MLCGRQRYGNVHGHAGGFRKRPHDQQAGYRVLAYPIAQTFREFQAVGNHAVRRTSSDVDSVSATLGAVRRYGGRRADTDDGALRFCQFDRALVRLACHRLGGLY